MLSGKINNCQHETLITNRFIISTKPCGTLATGKRILATALPTPWYRPAPSSSGERPSGSYYAMLKEASQRLNFTYSIVTMAGTGAKVNGTWTGAMGDVFYRRIHIALTNGLTESRNVIADGSGLLCYLKKDFWVRVYRRMQRAGAVLQPFTPLVWAATVYKKKVYIPFGTFSFMAPYLCY